ncbi:WbqC family protein [Flagellimonas sp. S3867]|uniref:WbqC family protein n=1 Tax=Flagellimonas sp. S3867 TaxID=2768063 RepID=UPI001685C001|nr:WbqC family protein [Flagellimonas sp. S3867]
MSKTLIHPAYFPSIATFAVIIQKDVIWEVHDNFQKQTYRNRCYVCTDQGKHMLNIPIRHLGVEHGRQKYNEVIPDNSYPWQKIHWKTLQTAYRTSPFFEFYEDDLEFIFEEEHSTLFDFNMKTIMAIGDCLGVQIPIQKTETFEKKPSQYADARFLVEAKQVLTMNMNPYPQVFGERHGFIPNLSILDLLFNEGTNALTYLKNQSLDFLNV